MQAPTRLFGTASSLLALVALSFIGSLAWTLAGPAACHATQITIVNLDAAGEGFNDATPAAPVGGNPGTTRGAQRLFVFETAASIWEGILDSNVEILVNAQFNPLSCTANTATLGSAGAVEVFSDFSGAEFTNTWYQSALANRLHGSDLSPAQPDINAQFNSTLDNGTCLGGVTWYYGIDGNEGAQIELLPVVLHELGHGLGFAQTASLSNGTLAGGRSDIYQRFMYDNSVGLTWNNMTNGQRVISARNTGNVVWIGPAVTLMAPSFLGVRTEVRVTAPPGIAGLKQFATAAFGPSPSASVVTGQVALFDDGAAPNSDACTPAVNGGALAGKIVFIDRGTCPFVDKALRAQNEGAIAVVIANNVTGAPPLMGGDDPGITIPVISITLSDGNAIRGQLGGGVSMTIGPNPPFMAGADDQGRVQLYAPNPVEQGSSISHWDVSAEPSLLMEPAITNGLSSSVDLTRFHFEDIGWFIPRTTDAPGGPVMLRLSGNSPNPFVSATTIRFELGQPSRAAIELFDAAGRQVRRVLDEELPAGAHQVRWDGTDDQGARVAPGVYFYRLKAGASAAVRRAIVLGGPTLP